MSNTRVALRAGFIGLTILRPVERGQAVVVLDDLSGSDLKSVSVFALIESNVRDRDPVDRAPTDCEMVVHRGTP